MIRNLFGFFIVLIVLSSCTVYKEYPIDIYKPGEISVPPSAENIALVYRNFKFKTDTLQHFYQNENKLEKAKNDPIGLDSILAELCLNELATNLKSNNSFQQIHIFPGVFKAHSGAKLPTLSPSLVNKFSSSTNSDLIISLETFSYFFSVYEIEQDVPKSREVVTAAVWAVYDPITEKVINRKTMIDTLYWNAFDEKGNVQKDSKLPPRLTCLQIASQMAGENFSKHFFASWQSVKRMYSVPPLPDFEEADKYLQKGDWDNAILLWKNYAPDNNGKMAINARYNLALAYEMKDEIEEAWKWLSEAMEIATQYKSKENIEMIEKYQKVLLERKKEIDRLNNS